MLQSTALSNTLPTTCPSASERKTLHFSTLDESLPSVCPLPHPTPPQTIPLSPFPPPSRTPSLHYLSSPPTVPLPSSPPALRLASIEKFSRFGRLLESNINTLHMACRGVSMSQRELMSNINLLAKDLKCFAKGKESAGGGMSSTVGHF